MAKRYLVLDVETPNRRNDRICAISAIQIVDWVIAEKLFFLVNPEAEYEQFNIDLHGITEKTTVNAKTFPEIWQILEGRFNASVIVAHNAPFDIRVIESCCVAYGLDFIRPQYVDTVQLSRVALPELSHHRLNDVCEAWSIPLDHHDAESDCSACAEIFLRCAMNGMDLPSFVRQYKESSGRWKAKNANSDQTSVNGRTASDFGSKIERAQSQHQWKSVSSGAGYIFVGTVFYTFGLIVLFGSWFWGLALCAFSIWLFNTGAKKMHPNEVRKTPRWVIVLTVVALFLACAAHSPSTSNTSAASSTPAASMTETE